MQTKDDHYTRRKKWVGGIGVLLFIVISVLLTILFTRILAPYLHSAAELRAFLDAYGWKGRFILFGLQCLQIVIACIPGEILELGAGYAYGAVEGALICLCGIALSSAVIFLLVKKWGAPIAELLISRSKLQQLSFINTEYKLKRLVFILFLIPGTPKDVLTYFVGLTDMRVVPFLCVSLTARIPSVVSSTVCGQMLGDRDYVMALVVYAVTGAVSAIGYYVYTVMIKRRENAN